MEHKGILNSLLEQAGKYHPVYGGGLATHLPMVLIALNSLNASDDTLLRTFNASVGDLELIGDVNASACVDELTQALGDAASFRGYLGYFNRELARHGISSVLRQSLPVLMPGIAASAFHALIRLAYAIEAGCTSEVAVALAFWCAEYQAFELSRERTDESLPGILTRLSATTAHHRFSPGIIVDRMAEINLLLQRDAAMVQPSSITLAQVRAFAAKAFFLKDDFTLLHTVTGCHALSLLLPYLDDEEAGLREFWKAVLVAYLSTGLGHEDNALPVLQQDVDFSALIDAARSSADSHVIKLVYSCVREYRVCHDPLYYLLARRAVSDQGA
jgi:hypothetical protein